MTDWTPEPGKLAAVEVEVRNIISDKVVIKGYNYVIPLECFRPLPRAITPAELALVEASIGWLAGHGSEYWRGYFEAMQKAAAIVRTAIIEEETRGAGMETSKS